MWREIERHDAWNLGHLDGRSARWRRSSKRFLQPWQKTFPYEFYVELYRIRGWSGPDGHKRTHQGARDTNDLVYSRLAPGVLDELQRLNPTLPGGGRKWRHHQWFTPDPGYITLNQHIAGVMAIMQA